MRLMVWCLLGASLCIGAVSGEFVVKKKKKGPSTQALKEQCCQLSGQLIGLFPDMLHSIADIQSVAIATIQGALDGDAASFCECASKSQLADCIASLELLHVELKRVKTELDRHCSLMQTLQPKTT